MKKDFSFSTFDWIIFGFILHAIGGIFFNSSKTICYTLCGIGLVIIFFNLCFNIKNIMPFKGNILLLYFFYLLWNTLIILRPIFSSEPFSWDGFSLISPITWLAYITPLFVFLGFKNLSLTSLFKFSYVYCIIGIVLLIIKHRDIFAVDQNFDSDEYQTYIGVAGIPLEFLSFSSFLVLCHKILPRRYKIVGFSTMFLAVFVALFTARRSNVFMDLLILFFTIFLYVFASKNKSNILKILSACLVLTLGFLAFNGYSNSIFSLFLLRLNENTRIGVVEYFYESFQSTTMDWIVGRGINGTYNCPIFDNSNRSMIETGYLHLILKGGLIYLIFYIIFLGHSAYLGYFRTNNILTKAMALYLAAHIIYLVPWGLPAFNFEFIIVWICILYCQSQKWRMLSDNKIINHLGL
jgi:hypothetical protein